MKVNTLPAIAADTLVKKSPSTQGVLSADFSSELNNQLAVVGGKTATHSTVDEELTEDSSQANSLISALILNDISGIGITLPTVIGIDSREKIDNHSGAEKGKNLNFDFIAPINGQQIPWRDSLPSVNATELLSGVLVPAVPDKQLTVEQIETLPASTITDMQDLSNGSLTTQKKIPLISAVGTSNELSPHDPLQAGLIGQGEKMSTDGPIQSVEPATTFVLSGHKNEPGLITSRLAESVHAVHIASPSVGHVTSPEQQSSAGVLNQELGTPAWQNSFSQQISLFTRNGIHNAELRLHPQELGSLQINLRLNNDQVQLHFVTENHQVRAAIEAAIPHLRTTLAESGLTLGQSSVGADASSSGSYSQSDQSSSHSHNLPGNATAETDQLSEERAGSVIRTLRYTSGINTFA